MRSGGIQQGLVMSKIYESPAGGETVYVRNHGGVERELHHVSSAQKDLLEQLHEDNLWGNIRRLAKTDEGLRELLDRAIIYYNLKKSNGNKTL